MSIEGLEKEQNLSEKQEEMLNDFSKEIFPSIQLLKQTGDSKFSDEVFQAMQDFKDALEKEDISIPDDQIEKVVQDLFNAKEAA